MASPRGSMVTLSEEPYHEPKHLVQDESSQKETNAPSGTHGTAHQVQYASVTFDTHIPRFISQDSSHQNQPLEPPNLFPYTSPLTWSHSRKTLVLILSCTITLLAGYSAGSYSIAAGPLQRKWNLSNIPFNTGVTTWAVGFAVSPMFLAPLSEINGRRPVFIGSGVLFVVALIGCAVTDSFAGMLVARFFVGAGASTFATMVGGVVSDVYAAEERNAPMAIYSGSALAGTGLGPMISGFIVERVDWRWVFWVQVISVGLCMVAVMLFFHETRGSVLLSRKAKALNGYLEKMEDAGYLVDATSISPVESSETLSSKPTHHPLHFRYKVPRDTSTSLSRMLYLSLTTPFKLLTTEPVVAAFSLWVAFAWGLLYGTFDAIPLVFRTHHDFTTSQTGAVFAAITIGSIIATILSVYQENLARRSRWGNTLSASPEGRLYFACLESACLPIGLFWFGWTSFRSTHWIIPVLGLACAQIGIFTIYLAVFNYLADVYHRYASSALAGQSFCRNILAALFPLFTDKMFRDLGYPGAASLLGGISAVLTVVPFVLVLWGPRIRARSKIASEIVHEGERGEDVDD